MIESERQLETLIDLERARVLERELRLESEALLSGLNTLSRAESPQQMFSELIVVFRSVFEFEDAFIIAETEKNTMEVLSSSSEQFQGSKWFSDKLFNRVINGEPIAVFDVSHVEEWKSIPSSLKQGIQSALHVPLSKQPQPAILICTHSTQHFFGPKHVKIARRFSPLTSQAFVNIELKRAVAERDRLFTLSLDMMGITNFEGVFKQVNSAWGVTLGYSSHELYNKRLMKFIIPEDRKILLNSFRDLLLGIENEEFEIRCYTKKREIKWLLCSVGVCVTDRLCYVVARDITNRKKTEYKLAFEADHDSLTGLANRKYMMSKLSIAIGNNQHSLQHHFAVLFLDLDRFKIVNDSLGHLIGDELLKEISNRLSKISSLDNTVARLGGDEFLILLENIENFNLAVKTAKLVQQELKLPIRLNGYNIVCTASIGITSSAVHYLNSAEVLRDADIAMYLAKAQGGASHFVFDHTMHAKAISQLQMETDLRNAIFNEELEIFYQPIFDIKNGLISGFEALIRWQHQTKGKMSADEFIPIAEESELITLIGLWTMERVCNDIHSWKKNDAFSDAFYVSINLSAKQFWQKDLLFQIKKQIEAYGLTPQCIKFELTESLFMDNTIDSLALLNSLKQYGISLYMDDFGTGYSSLSYLHQLPFDVLKIDKSFISRMESDEASLNLVRTIILLAQSLNLGIIAEGIESQSQRDLLLKMDCNYGQGFLLSYPMSAIEINKHFQNEEQHISPSKSLYN